MPLRRAQLSVKFTLDRLRAQTKELSDQRYPGDHQGPRKWLALVEGLLDTADEYLQASSDTQITDEKALTLARDAANIASNVYTCLDFMSGASIDELPYQVVQPLQRWFNLLEIDKETLFRAELVANYELRTIENVFKRIRNPSEKLEEAINEIKWPIIRVTVPSRAFGILPHFAIVAHEIGHALFSRINWDVSSFTEEYNNLLQRISTRLDDAQLDSNIKTKVLFIFYKWFEELAADAFAFFLTGPAIFFSSSGFFQLLGGDYGISDTHPSHDLRRKILFDKLIEGDSDSFAAVFTKYTGHQLTVDYNSPLMIQTPSTDDVFSDKSKRYDTSIAAILAEMHLSIADTVEIIYGEVEKYLKTHANDAIYTTKQYRTDLEEHLDAMLSAIPPIENGDSLKSKQPTEFASILNVGWTTLLAKLPDLRVKVDDNVFGSEKLEKLHGLLLKAVELSEARREWMNA
ncbi:MAG: hypothetical protein AB2696_08095 [Candidatus Thiodiazotropha sp.]|nr:hypothetical protein [Candidatus Thiodiazotropha sp. (ex Lucina pensylvanica)]